MYLFVAKYPQCSSASSESPQMIQSFQTHLKYCLPTSILCVQSPVRSGFPPSSEPPPHFHLFKLTNSAKYYLSAVLDLFM